MKLSISFVALALLSFASVASAQVKSTNPPAPAATIFGAHYIGGTLPAVKAPAWIALSASSTAVSFYSSDGMTSGKTKNPSSPSINSAKDATKYYSKAGSTPIFTIPPSAIKTISLSQEKHHRVGTGIALSVISLGVGVPVMFTKSTKDFIGVTWDNAGQKGSVEFQADKHDYRAVLSALSGVSGVQPTNAIDSQTDAKKK